ncbi:COX15/CtaA family protein [uncultured Porticoccus sp.]|uniref:COX15/CtaA family protein n=1 Tax=uncultured Porticoccus sp. TaxID=1256050 RepID=UPI0026083D5F|nr:COX15/CtaA family protein [uncultured Porticoccus sp.]
MDLQTRYDRQLASWLVVCAAVILSMILLGGVTRLTGSGLSIVEWAPVSGVLPPLNEQEWQQTFDKYKQFPEYQKVNSGMSLPEFKRIFLYEYAHRLLGRLIGVLFLVPFLAFYFSRRIKPGLTPKLVVMFILGGLQGLLGWYMVKSGLVDNPNVSQYRLTAHLGTAVIIYGYIIWVAFSLFYPPERDRQHGQPSYRRFAVVLTGLVFLMILSGGFVAGTDAGYAYPTFPLMGTSFVPSGIYGTEPFWLAIFEDITTIQFNHRMFAYLLIVVIISFAVGALKHGNIRPEARVGVKLMLIMLVVQVTLGISTLLLHMPVPLAAAHQGGAILLFTSVLFVCHRLGN